MTRSHLQQRLEPLTGAARAAGLTVEVTVATAATEAELRACEEQLGGRIHDGYRSSLLEWNGCMIRILQPKPDGGSWERVAFTLFGATQLSAATKNLRRHVDIVVSETPRTRSLRNALLRYAAISYHDDIAALVNVFESGDASVRYIDLEYVSNESTELVRIADSADEYIEKCLARLTQTLETEIYWW